MRVIVDTNVFVSGLISPAGPPARILDAVIEGTITAVFSTETLAELREVLRKPSLQRYLVRTDVEPEIFLSCLAEIVEIVEPETTAASIRDPKDQPFLALASCTPRADALVTGDRDFTADSYCGVPVIPPALLADMLKQAGRAEARSRARIVQRIKMSGPVCAIRQLLWKNPRKQISNRMHGQSKAHGSLWGVRFQLGSGAMQQFKDQSCAFLNYEIRKTHERGQSTMPSYDFRAFRVFRSFRFLVCNFPGVA